ncbi:MAG: LysM peptidoglycan-binding domain-containing protein [Saprospiraceae bacterium]|nr:LysM peptidoglycan-binding domain-containing protein [Saprospiraceae bacterium]
MRILLCSGFIILFSLVLEGQSFDRRAIDSLTKAHQSDIQKPYLTITNASALQPFFDKLEVLASSKSKRQRVSIAHIGDSHIQADYLPGVLRQLFWSDFGYAGRGLVFPYRLAGTHGPLDYEWIGTNDWVVRRRTYQKNGPPIGVSGMGLQAQNEKISIQYTTKPEALPFNRIVVYGDTMSNWEILALDQTIPPLVPAAWAYHQVSAGETLYGLSKQYECSIYDLQRWNNLSGHHIQAGQVLKIKPLPLQNQTTRLTQLAASPGIYHTTLRYPVRAFHLKAYNTNGPELYGVQLENTSESGVLYHMIGVNGTTYFHYNRDKLFIQQLAILDPALIMIHLGTNEALQKSFSDELIWKEVLRFLQKLKENIPDAAILISTSPDAGKQNRTLLENPSRMRSVLLRAAERENIAIFDFYALMGGKGSIYKWKEKGLAHKDYIHFTKKGYTFQASLLYTALMKAYYDRN